MRQLASIQIINEIKPIEGADCIEVAKVLDWHVVIKKNEFKIGDKCIYVEIDSIMPEHADFEFLRDVNFRIKTRKMRGQISQGIIFPLKIYGKDFSKHNINDDITDALDIVKYETQDEKEECTEIKKRMPKTWYGKYVYKIKKYFKDDVKYSWPSWLPHTDETRIQSCGRILEEMRGETCYISVKMDGQSFSAYVDNVIGKNCFLKCKSFIKKVFNKGDVEKQLFVCSRSQNKPKDNGDFWQNAEQHDLLNKLSMFNGRYAIQAEQCGKKIQKNKMGVEGLELFVFNVFDREEKRFVDYSEMLAICKTMGLQTVPILTDKFVIDERVTVDYLLELAKGKYSNGHIREGIVIRPIKERMCKTLKGRTSFKAVNNDYLLKEAKEKN